MNKERITALDGMKGVACILLACAYHYGGIFPQNYFIMHLNRLVEIFLCCSGFCIAYVYKERIKDISFVQFIKGRMIKLLPLYWVTLLANLCFQIWHTVKFGATYGGLDISLKHILLSFLCIENGWIQISNPVNGPAWAINVLFLCYVIYYIVCRSSRGSANKYIIFIVGILLFSLAGISCELNIPFAFYDTSLRAYGSFFMGVMLFEIRNHMTDKGGTILSAILVCTLLSEIVISNILGCNLENVFGDDKIISIVYFCPLIILSILYIVPVKKLLETRIFQFFGSISMSVYLWHWFLLAIVNMFDYWGKINIWLCYVVVLIIISCISHYYLEPKMNKAMMRMDSWLWIK